MDTKEFLNNVCKEIKYKPVSKPISDELDGHIEDIKTEYLCKGYSEKEAEEKAVEQMGDAKQIGKKLDKIHRPRVDWIMLIFALVFLWFSNFHLVVYYQSDWWDVIDSFYWRAHFKIETLGIFLGIALSIYLFFFDYRKICKHSKLIYIFATVLNIVAYLRGFRANGNLLYGLYPFMQGSPAVLTVPLYIISFVGFIKDINKESKINITISNGRKINTNIISLIILSILSIITSLMINFVSGFLVAIVYLIISARELLIRKQLKNTAIFIGASILVFVLLSAIICIIPVKWKMGSYYEKLTSAYWVGADTVGERRIDFVRGEIFKAAKPFGKANLEGISLKDEQGYYSSIDGWFSRNGDFAFLGILREYGWVASIGLVVVLLLFNIKLIINVIKMKDIYGKLLTIGITSLFIVQILCNLAMNFGIIGVAEFNLPLISGGKAELITNMLCTALLLSVYRRKDINFIEPKKSKLAEKLKEFFTEEVTEEIPNKEMD